MGKTYEAYFEYGGNTYRLPVNPEEIQKSGSMDAEKYRMLTGEQIVMPVGRTLSEMSFEAEFPCEQRPYCNEGFLDAATWERLLLQWSRDKAVVRFIASSGNGDEHNMECLITKIDAVEKAGEEGDKYISLTLLEYAGPQKKFVAVQTMRKTPAVAENPAVTPGKTHTVVKGDTLWGIAKKYYGNGSQYGKIVSANAGKIKNPNLIYPGQVFTIP